jgi:hypothetical protein
MPQAEDLRRILEAVDPGLGNIEPEVEVGEQTELADWGRLFPPKGQVLRSGELDYELSGDQDWWRPQFPADLTEEVGEAILAGQHWPAQPEAPCGDPSTAHRCAWYVPLHRSISHWGIYIRESCIFDRMPQIASRLGGHRVTPDLLKALYRAAAFELFLHEQFHHKVESLGFRLVIVENRLRYLDYDQKVYQRVLGTDDCLEEALANADAHRRLSENAYASWMGPTVVRAARDSLERSWRQSPPGYRKAGLYVGGRSNRDALALFKAQVHEARTRPRRVDPWRHSANMHESLFSVTSNIYVVIPVGTTPVMPVR